MVNLYCAFVLFVLTCVCDCLGLCCCVCVFYGENSVLLFAFLGLFCYLEVVVFS